MKSPIRPTDPDAIETARALTKAATGSLATLDADGHPHVTKIAVAWLDGPVTLVSDLSDHTKHLRADPRMSLLLGDAGAKGDPLNQPRMTLVGRARFVEKALRDAWLDKHPKAKLYIDFTDFHFVRFDVEAIHLNGGFGKAYRLTAADLEG